LAIPLEREGDVKKKTEAFQGEVNIIRGQRQKKKRCISAEQKKGHIPFVAGGIGLISPFLFSKKADQTVSPSSGGRYAGRSEDGACFRL
jgi:hypothetical protein